MATTLTINRIKVDLSGTFENDELLAPNKSTLALSIALAFAQGTGAGSANKIYIKRRTLAAVTSENLDLAATLTDPHGTVLSFTKIRAMVFGLAASPAAGPLLIGGHATAGLANWITSVGVFNTDQPRIRMRNGPAGGAFLLTAGDATGFAVTATTGDIMKVENEHATLVATYDVAFVGE